MMDESVLQMFRNTRAYHKAMEAKQMEKKGDEGYLHEDTRTLEEKMREQELMIQEMKERKGDPMLSKGSLLKSERFTPRKERSESVLAIRRNMRKQHYIQPEFPTVNQPSKIERKRIARNNIHSVYDTKENLPTQPLFEESSQNNSETFQSPQSISHTYIDHPQYQMQASSRNPYGYSNEYSSVQSSQPYHHSIVQSQDSSYITYPFSVTYNTPNKESKKVVIPNPHDERVLPGYSSLKKKSSFINKQQNTRLRAVQKGWRVRKRFYSRKGTTLKQQLLDTRAFLKNLRIENSPENFSLMRQLERQCDRLVEKFITFLNDFHTPFVDTPKKVTPQRKVTPLKKHTKSIKKASKKKEKIKSKFSSPQKRRKSSPKRQNALIEQLAPSENSKGEYSRRLQNNSLPHSQHLNSSLVPKISSPLTQVASKNMPKDSSASDDSIVSRNISKSSSPNSTSISSDANSKDEQYMLKQAPKNDNQTPNQNITANQLQHFEKSQVESVPQDLDTSSESSEDNESPEKLEGTKAQSLEEEILDMVPRIQPPIAHHPPNSKYQQRIEKLQQLMDSDSVKFHQTLSSAFLTKDVNSKIPCFSFATLKQRYHPVKPSVIEELKIIGQSSITPCE